eukprot:CAMPEP_0185300586 /NCGR_PEP_ID=MMETSP1363-20130426/12127_1 /TAXON_ID=38817 /ORGANISM="Gephyrocapsa oceanica, Strain RCC1303" /LENGTH=76 /DNA_ID=CAMNT_0027897557 /DNA_START=270 /DNA_END=500 /DNA_ORIENTATION=-
MRRPPPALERSNTPFLPLPPLLGRLLGGTAEDAAAHDAASSGGTSSSSSPPAAAAEANEEAEAVKAAAEATRGCEW